MNFLFLLTVFIIGASGIIAQIIILRELLVSFLGNELTIGIILANWLLSEACGVFVAGRWADRLKNKFNLFLILQIIFSLFLPFSLTASRLAKYLLGIPYGEALSLYAIFFISLLVLFPIGFSHAAMFSVGCKIYSKLSGNAAGSVSRVYFWETFGTLFGGVAITYLLIPYLNPFQAVFAVSFSNLFISLFFLRRAYWVTQITIFSFCLLYAFFGVGGIPQVIDHFTMHKKWDKTELIGYRNSVYGNIAVTRQDQQNTFYYNGNPAITVPYPDITFVEEFANIPLFLHPWPRKVLVAGSGAGGLLSEVLKHPVESVDYVELDPLLIRMLKNYPDPLTQTELSDRRLSAKFSDARLYLKENPVEYDVILLGLSRPADLSANRFFSKEFFSLVKNRLRPHGLFALWLPGSSTFLSQELIDTNACILKGLQGVFAYVRVVPGDYNIIISSDNKGVMKVDSAVVMEESKKRGVLPSLFTRSHLDYLFDARRLEWFRSNIRKSKVGVNSDLLPVAVFQMLIFWNKQAAPFAAVVLEGAQKLNFAWLAAFIILALFLLYLLWGRKRKERFTWSICIASTGFFAMLSTLTLSFSYQVFYGYLYHRIGILISVFMAGAALGSILMGIWLPRLKNLMAALLALEALIVSFALGLCLLFVYPELRQYLNELVFAVLFFACGALTGMEFPLASAIYIQKEKGVGRATGILYAMDLLGGWVAGVLGGIILIPLYGVFNTFLLIVIIKLWSFSRVFFVRAQS